MPPEILHDLWTILAYFSFTMPSLSSFLLFHKPDTRCIPRNSTRNEILPLIRAGHCKQLELEIVEINLQPVRELFIAQFFNGMKNKFYALYKLRYYFYRYCYEIIKSIDQRKLRALFNYFFFFMI